jgi:hypothetical protein
MLNIFKWLTKLSKKIFDLLFLRTLVIIFFTQISRIIVLVYSLLPLKIILLLGSKNIPEYFPSILHGFGYEKLILSLTFFIMIFYLVGLFIDKQIETLKKEGGNFIINNSKKFTFINKKNFIVEKTYDRFTEITSSIVFIFLAFFLISLIYLELAFFVFLIVLINIIIIKLFSISFFSEILDNSNTKHLNKISIFSNISFLLSIIFIIYQFAFWEAPSILIAIICILLIRQCSSYLISIFNLSKALYLQKEIINSLIFDKKYLRIERNLKDRKFWRFTNLDYSRNLIKNIIKDLGLNNHKRFDSKLFSINNPDIIAFIVTLNKNEIKSERKYFIKIYNEKKTFLAEQEVELIKKIPSLPSLELLLKKQISNFKCLVYRWPKKTFNQKQDLKKINLHIKKVLIKTPIPVPFLEKYRRTYPILPDRLNKDFWQRADSIFRFSNNKNLFQKNKVLKNFNKINSILQKLPLVILAKKIDKKNFILNNKKVINLINWDGWSLEPVGANLNEQEIKNTKLLQYAINAIHKKKNQHKINIFHLKFTSLLFNFEKSVSQNKFEDANRQINEIFKIISKKLI